MKKQNRVGSRLFMALVFLFLYAPIVLLIVFSFNAGNSNAVWKGFSLQWYTALFNDRVVMQSVYTTLLVSVLATVIATVAGTFASIGFYNMSRRLRQPLKIINDSPQLYLGFGTLLLAHISFNIPYVILNVMPKLRQMDKNLVDAAQDLGCTWFRAFRKVILPEIKPGIVSGALIAFTMSIDDFVISYFTAGSSSQTLAMAIYGMTKKRVSPEINAVSTLLFAVVLVLLVIVNARDVRAERAAAKRQP
jgi:spermidine/putrescine transport system permease protein